LGDDPDGEWYCTKCGHASDAAALFCSQCGDRFEDETATFEDPEAVEGAPRSFDELRVELAEVTNDWTIPVVVRTYGPDDDGQEDYEDEAMVFVDEHGYDASVVRGMAALTATYRKGIADPTGSSPRWWSSFGSLPDPSDDGPTTPAAPLQATLPIPPVRVEFLVSWLRDNRSASTAEELRKRLVAAGHAATDVDAAIARLRAEDAEAPVARPPVALPPRMGTSFCPRCGTQRVGAYRFCRSCQFDFDEIEPGAGTPTTPGGTATQNETGGQAASRPSTRPLAVAGVVVLGIAILGIMFLRPFSSPDSQATMTDAARLWCLDNDQPQTGFGMTADRPDLVTAAANKLGIAVPKAVADYAAAAEMSFASQGAVAIPDDVAMAYVDFAYPSSGTPAMEAWRASPEYGRACMAAFGTK